MAQKPHRPRESTSLKIRHFKQSRAMCGPACLKIVLAYFGTNVSEAAIAKACRSDRISGTTGINLVQGARRLGFAAEMFDRSSLRAIERWLRRKVPVIVDWMSTVTTGDSQTAMACGHYSVVYGMDKHHITLADPALGCKRRIARQAFLNVWFGFKQIVPRRNDDLLIRRMIVVVPRAQGLL
ncbi:MAG: cysteine peptidase family C39 domain-containing protein, partial [Candidatus Binatia bacterium]